MENIDNNLLTREQVAAMLNIRPSTVGKLARNGKLPRIMVGPKLNRFLKSDIEAYIAKNRK